MSDTWDSAPLASQAPPVKAPSWDSAPLAGPTAQQKAVVDSNAVPEEAAQALTLSKQTNIPATVIQSNLPEYKDHARQQAAVKAAANPALAKYIDGNPMAAKVSADDYGKLDEVSQTLAALHPELIKSQAQGGLFAGLSEVGELLQTDAGKTKLTNALIALPYHLGKGVYDFAKSAVMRPGEVMQKGMTSGEDEDIALGIGIALGAGGPKGTMKVGRAEPTPPAGGLTSFDDFMHTLEGMKTRKEIDDFIASKTPGPPGAMLQIEHAKAGGQALDRAVEVAQGSKTKERAPELFEEAAQAHDPGNVHVDAQKILDLYSKEGKAPVEGDGLFGFVPDIAAKAQAAAATGGEVTIPVSKYIAHVDPTVHEGLKDSVRLHDDGVTAAEAEEIKKEIEAWHGTPHDFERFDLSKIGTGEGAQVYGYGLYFAENQKVGQQYKDQLAPGENVNGERFNANDPLHIAAKELSTAGHVDDAIINLQTRQAKFNKTNDPFGAEFDKYKWAIKALENAAVDGKLPKYDAGKEGQLYKVSINADPTHFLDWDKPLSEQSQHVQDAVRGMANPAQLELMNSGLPVGEQLRLGHLPNSFDFQSPEFAKQYAEAGIPGIKYLDQGSRGVRDVADIKERLQIAKDLLEQNPTEVNKAILEKSVTDLTEELKKAENGGTRNFVVFDDRLVKIKEKNGNPVAEMVDAAVEAQKLFMGLKTTPFMNMLFKDGKAVGITEGEIKQYSDKIARQEQAILDKAVAVGKREAGRRLTPEWKRNEAATRDEVIGDLTSQGAFAAEKFLRENKITLGGDNIDQIADDLAPLWGFETGNDLRAALEGLEIEQAASGKNVQTQLKDAITAETARRMEEKYGNLAENIAKEAREIALADHTFDVLADEVRLLAKAAGTTQALTRAEMVAYGKDIFERSNVVEAGNWEKARRAVERSGREAEKALLKGDFQEAFQWKQRQMIAAMVAKQSAELQGLIDRTEKKIDRWQSNETIKGLDQAHLEQIRQVLASIGLPQHFAPLADTPALRDFAAQSEGQIAAAPWLMDGSQPKLKDMSVEQFRDLAKSLDSIAHVGRQVEKLFSAGKEAELQNVVFDAVKALERFPFIDQPNRPNFLQRLQSYGRQVVGAHLLVERVLDYTDQFNPHGPLTEWLDRPLRDANSKEIVLTEQVVRMLRDLRQHTTTDTNALIDNKLIPDANDKTGFLRMTHHELRTLMLNSGNWSNLGKMTKGFGVNEADLRRFVDQHATAADVAFVNGIWKVFDHLKPEADAVQLRDTGVPVDTIEGVPWEVKAGKLNGGYYPLSYDPYNSDIQGHIAKPLFDKGYYAATTPHGYTQERTNYAGALDLSGTFLNSKIRGMIHDIAFREAVRNANKLIENQEFRTAVAQHWGKEVSDLLPGWLRDIANSHNLDDNYAQGLVRGASLIRQNVVSTLIAFNPGTFIKHGFTAMVMSIDRVGGGKLLSAANDLGLSALGKNASELLWKSDTLPDEAFMQSFRDALDQGKRGDNARQFVLQSSAVMRQRQAQWDDSIYGAVQQLQNAGVAQTLAEFRQRAMLYGRLGVAYSDQFSAMPTWLAAYKNAFAKGETHEDAVFQADKEVSRAHGSAFVGDKPRVSRTGNSGPGEFVKWFTGLYNFWNHQFNNLLALVWDTSARINGRQEPNADWASITKRIGYVAGIVLIEEMASAAKDEDHRSLGMKMASATLRYLGGSFVGLREITNGLAHGYEPSTGMLGTLFKAMSDTSKDLAKATSLKAGVAKDAITHTATLLGFATGVGGSQVGKVGQFAHDVAVGKDRPRTFNDYRQGLRTGHSKARTH